MTLVILATLGGQVLGFALSQGWLEIRHRRRMRQL